MRQMQNSLSGRKLQACNGNIDPSPSARRHLIRNNIISEIFTESLANSKLSWHLWEAPQQSGIVASLVMRIVTFERNLSAP